MRRRSHPIAFAPGLIMLLVGGEQQAPPPDVQEATMIWLATHGLAATPTCGGDVLRCPSPETAAGRSKLFNAESGGAACCGSGRLEFTPPGDDRGVSVVIAPAGSL